jgi:hypothetical protein
MPPQRISPALLLRFEELADEVVRLAYLEGIERVIRFHEVLGFLLQKHRGYVEAGYQPDAAGTLVLREFGNPLVMARPLRPPWWERWGLQWQTALVRWAYIAVWLAVSPFALSLVMLKEPVTLPVLSPFASLAWLLPVTLGVGLVRHLLPTGIRSPKALRRGMTWVFFLTVFLLQFFTVRAVLDPTTQLRLDLTGWLTLAGLLVGAIPFVLAMVIEVLEMPGWWLNRQRQRRMAELEDSKSQG